MNKFNGSLLPNRIVLKVGGDTLMRKNRKLNRGAFRKIARQIATLIAAGHEVIVVTSAGIPAGEASLKSLGIRLTKEMSKKKKLLAGVGAERLLSMWAREFRPFGIAICQFWLTHSNWKNPSERKSIKDTILEALSVGVVPIVNENDVVSATEIELMLKGWGENDNMAARVATLVSVSAALFLSSVGWIYEKNPREHRRARQFLEINAWRIPRELQCPNGSSFHGDGKDGINNIKTKVDAVALCHRRGMRVNVASLDSARNIIVRFASGKDFGTRIGSRNRLKG